MGDDIRNWPMAAAWPVVVELVAATYGVNAAAITAESRGRGPRPPEAIRLPKKLALYLTASLSNCDFAALSRHVGLHKDTVTTHCNWAHGACLKDPQLDRVVQTIGSAAIVRLELSGVWEAALAPAAVEFGRLVVARDQVRALRKFMNGVFSETLEALSDEEEIPSDDFDLHPTEAKKILRRVA